jgi:putative nucleotidyltransferase with HDIG domain
VKLPPLARAYLYLVAAAACVAQAAWIGYALRVGRGGIAPTPSIAGLWVELLLLTVAATLSSVPVSPHRKVLVADAPLFAALLLFGPPLAVALAGASQRIAQSVLVVRRIRSTRSVVFNTAQFIVSMALAGVADVVVPAPLNLVASAGIWYAANTMAVAVMSGLQLGLSPLPLWRLSVRRNALQVVALLFLGWMTARAAAQDPWVPLIMIVPGAVIQVSMKRNVQLEEQTVQAVEALADVVDERDRYTFEHSKRVATYAEKIARAMRLPSDEVETIRLAARVHDLGKVGIPDEVLRKPGKLTPEEMDLMRQHAEKGYEILSRFPEYAKGRELVRSHHEQLDGKGYPRAIPGEAIPLGAQIIAVADTLDAMTSDRPYRRALPLEAALEVLRGGKGTHWNPRVVETLERLAGASGGRALGLAPVAPAPQGGA